jgi:hypothetical protein
MKRDMDLVRGILLAIEENESGFAPRQITIDGYSSEQIGYHVHIMIQGGLLKGAEVTHMHSASPESIASTMTWAGHDFIESARNAERWKQTKGLVEKVGGAAFNVWTTVLTHIVMKNLGLG